MAPKTTKHVLCSIYPKIFVEINSEPVSNQPEPTSTYCGVNLLEIIVSSLIEQKQLQKSFLNFLLRSY